jgi:hypothetical protein
MAIELAAILVRSNRRVRLVFSNVLAAGAFDAAKYAITNLDGKGPNEVVQEALIVPDSSNTVELNLKFDLAPSSLYRLAATAVPAQDASTVTTTQDFRIAGDPLPASPTVSIDDIDALTLGADLLWDGDDMVEDADGDLARVSGAQNAESALTRRMESDGIPWDPDYGLHPREYVDGPPGALPTLVSQASRQAKLDDRVKSVTVAVEPAVAGEEETAILSITPTFIGNRTVPTPIKLPIR